MTEETVLIGKYTLESLTTGMYADPRIIYREYIQNSVDSLEMAVKKGILDAKEMRIEILVNDEYSYISIKDNGTGIAADLAKETLLNVGASRKRSDSNRGFRGIGRLGGMSYCDTLVFTTSARGEKCKTITSFDCKKLRQLLVPGENEELSLVEVLSTVTNFQRLPEDSEKHYFEVELRDVSGYSDLLNLANITRYISQVAPVSYSRQFIYARQLRSELKKAGYTIEEFPIYIGDETSNLSQIYKPNRSIFHSGKKDTTDDITSMEYYQIEIDGEIYAVGWYGNCNWYGAIDEKDLAGIRVRKGNIQIGDSKTLNSIFKETRFNAWTQGEVFILSEKLIPNARRDDFEQTNAYFKFITELSNKLSPEISKKIRVASQLRNDPIGKVLKEGEQKASKVTAILDEGFNSSHDKDILLGELTKYVEKLEGTKTKDDQQTQQKQELIEKISDAIEQVNESSNFKINQINTGIDKKSRKVLQTVSEILSRKLAKFLVDEIIEEIVLELNGK